MQEKILRKSLGKRCVDRECKPSDEPCDKDQDCHGTDICVNHECKEKCREDGDCLEGYV